MSFILGGVGPIARKTPGFCRQVTCFGSKYVLPDHTFQRDETCLAPVGQESGGRSGMQTRLQGGYVCNLVR
jgi:hypothetical protein